MKPESEIAIVNSALWATAGDALGWITELADEGAVWARAGAARVSEPVEWRQIVGGSLGVRVSLPAGTYSDDTQLRLAVCRSIRRDGRFDAEAFARIELPVWRCYALGAGAGTLTAAANLARGAANWFSNFFAEGTQQYVRAGGNGAAMRVQPHVWASGEAKDKDARLLAVLRNALSTHGHPHGFCGAIFHALCLSDTLATRAVPGPPLWNEYADVLRDLPAIVSRDRDLEDNWRPAWERQTGQSLRHAVEAVREEILRDLGVVSRSATYPEALLALGCLDDRYRGSGLKTAIAAGTLSWLFRDRPVGEALVEAANTLGSDTDTIGTMAGAILGTLASQPPPWQIQDRRYIEEEASRLARISRGVVGDDFPYPDLATWEPPAVGDIVGRVGATLAVAGLGRAQPHGREYPAGDTIWQWLALPFGQTIFARRRRN